MSPMPSFNPPAGAAAPLREGTRLESVDEIRQAIQARRPATAKEAAAPDTQPFRPLRRPPVGHLCIVDDDGAEGEWLRLRADRVIIGRSDGDILIPHDAMMSGRHAELTRQGDGATWRWSLADLGSTNGTFVRVGAAVLQHRQELLLGGSRYRFEIPGATPDADASAAAGEPGSTRSWQTVAPADLFPCLVELTLRGEGRRFSLNGVDVRLGRNPTACAIVLAHDPLVSPQHARFYRDRKGRWRVENSKSINGVWVRVEQMDLDTTCQFQLGEQRFLLRVP